MSLSRSVGPQPEDPFASFAGLPAWLQGLGGAIGGAIGPPLQAALDLPVVGGALRGGLNVIAQTTPVGLAGLALDEEIRRRTAERLAREGLPAWMAPAIAREEVDLELQRIAEEPGAPAPLRVGAQTARGAGLLADIATPIGFGGRALLAGARALPSAGARGAVRAAGRELRREFVEPRTLRDVALGRVPAGAPVLAREIAADMQGPVYRAGQYVYGGEVMAPPTPVAPPRQLPLGVGPLPARRVETPPLAARPLARQVGQPELGLSRTAAEQAETRRVIAGFPGRALARVTVPFEAPPLQRAVDIGADDYPETALSSGTFWRAPGVLPGGGHIDLGRVEQIGEQGARFRYILLRRALANLDERTLQGLRRIVWDEDARDQVYVAAYNRKTDRISINPVGVDDRIAKAGEPGFTRTIAHEFGHRVMRRYVDESAVARRLVQMQLDVHYAFFEALDLASEWRKRFGGSPYSFVPGGANPVVRAGEFFADVFAMHQISPVDFARLPREIRDLVQFTRLEGLPEAQIRPIRTGFMGLDVGRAEAAAIRRRPASRFDIERIVRAYRALPEAVRVAGRAWYGQVRQEIRTIAERTGISDRQIVGVYAAVTPNTEWPRSRRSALAIIEAFARGDARPPATEALPEFDLYAWRILQGEDPARVFGKAARNKKTRSMFANLLGDETVTTVDRWAWRIATGRPDEAMPSSIIRGFFYDRIDNAYRRAALELDVSPAELQASVWLGRVGDAAIPEDLTARIAALPRVRVPPAPAIVRTIGGVSRGEIQGLRAGATTRQIERVAPFVREIVRNQGSEFGEPLMVGTGYWRGDPERDFHFVIDGAREGNEAALREIGDAPGGKQYAVMAAHLGQGTHPYVRLELIGAPHRQIEKLFALMKRRGFAPDAHLRFDPRGNVREIFVVAHEAEDLAALQQRMARIENFLADRGVSVSGSRRGTAEVVISSRERLEDQFVERRLGSLAEGRGGGGLGGGPGPLVYDARGAARLGGPAAGPGPAPGVGEGAYGGLPPAGPRGAGEGPGPLALEARAPSVPAYRPEMFAELGVEDLMREVDDAAGSFVAQRRGVVSDEELVQAAFREHTNLDPETVARITRGTALPAEQVVGLAMALGRSAVRRKEVQARVLAAGGADFASPQLRAELFLAAINQANLQRAFAGVRSEAGRALRALKVNLGQALVSGQPDAFDRALALVGKRENAESFITALQRIHADAKLSDVEKDVATYRFLRDMGEVGFWDRAHEWWLNAILSNPLTHEVNTLGTLSFVLAQPATTGVAAAIEAVAARIAGRPRQILFAEAVDEAVALFRAFGPAFKATWAAARHGVDAEELLRFKETGKLARVNAIPGKFGEAINIPTTLLGVEDSFNKFLARQMSLYRQARRTARIEGLQGLTFDARSAELVQRPTVEMMDTAREFARYVTFQSAPDRLTKAILAARQSIPGARFVLPFITTPSNLIRRGFEYSPLGLVRAASTSGAERSYAIARAAIGSGFTAFLATKFISGEMTGGPPENPGERDEWFRQGKVPYAVRFGDTWVQFARIEPLATHLRWLSGMFEAYRRSGEEPTAAQVNAVVGSIGRSLIDTTYLSGLVDFVNALEDPLDADRWLSRLAAGAVPFSGFARGLAQATDPTVRRPQGPLETAAANLPGTSQLVPPRLDVFGRLIERVASRQGLGALGISPLGPIQTSREERDPVDVELAEVRARVKDFDAIGFVRKAIGVAELDRAEQLRWQQLAGQETYAGLQRLFASQKYRGLAPEERAKNIEREIGFARERAKRQLATELVSSTDGAKRTKGLAVGLSAADSQLERAFLVEAMLPFLERNPELARLFDESRPQGALTFEQYRRVLPFVKRAAALPEFASPDGTPIGTPAEWERFHARDRELNRLGGIRTSEGRLFYLRNRSELEPWRRFSQRAGGRNPQLARLRREEPLLRRFTFPAEETD